MYNPPLRLMGDCELIYLAVKFSVFVKQALLVQ